MDDTGREHLPAIHGQLKKLNSHLKIMLFCMVAVTVTLVAEVYRHW